MATVLGPKPCPAECGSQAEVREGKNGTLTIYCPHCGTNSFVKSPKAVAALRAKLGGGGGASSSSPPEKKPTPAGAVTTKRGFMDDDDD